MTEDNVNDLVDGAEKFESQRKEATGHVNMSKRTPRQFDRSVVLLKSGIGRYYYFVHKQQILYSLFTYIHIPSYHTYYIINLPVSQLFISTKSVYQNTHCLLTSIINRSNSRHFTIFPWI